MKKTTKGKKTLPKIEIGSYHAGGIVFYIDETSEHGLVMAPIQGNKENSDLLDYYEVEEVEWGPMGLDVPGTFTDLGYGLSNTDLILAATPGIKTAASVCRDLKLNGYNDWFLPSVGELRLLHDELFDSDWYCMDGGSYWSSNQDYPFHAFEFSLGCEFYEEGDCRTFHKNEACYVLPIRSF
jgi:hypothetical protein